jgi:transposase
MPYSIDLRERVVAAIDKGMRKVTAAKTFNVSRRVVYKWIHLRKNTNSLAFQTGYQKGHSHKITDWDEFRKFAESHKHYTLKKMAEEWQKIFGKIISKTAMDEALKKIGYTSKKKRLDTSRQTQKSVSNF